MPSADDVIDVHDLVEPTLVSSVHVPPLLVEVQMLPEEATAVSFVPSADDVIEVHDLVEPTLVSLVNVHPLLV